jgi:hypothetical protein
LGNQKKTFVYESYTNWYQSYYWFYTFILNEVFPTKIKDFSLFQEYVEHSKHYHHIYLSPDLALFSDFPSAIRLDKKGKLSCEDGQALEYRDGYGIYALSGQVANSLLELQLT